MAESGKLFFAFRVKDVAESAKFYKRLGFEPTELDTWNSDYATFEYDGARVSLMTFIPQQVLVNLEQADAAGVSAMGDRLRSGGLSPVAAGQDGAGLFVEDPDGNGVYIFTNNT